MFNIALLWKAPEVNPVNRKARSIPGLNPINVYGRVFTFSWFGFMIAFWSWYAFPPLLTITIAGDLKLSKVDIANSNIIALTATLLVRLVAGPMCDRFGPRYTFAGCLLAGAIPTALAGAVTTTKGLLALRFFVGILGGSFVPCQVWSTGFFDKNVVGTANAFTGGFGNSGGGITYFLMPAIFDSLVNDQHLSTHVAWRVAFIVPFICITATAIAMLILCPDTPMGKWSERQLHVQQNLASHGVSAHIVQMSDKSTDKPVTSDVRDNHFHESADEKLGYRPQGDRKTIYDDEIQISEQQMLDVAQGEIVVKPSFKQAMTVILTPQALVQAGCYFCSFGSELAINSILGAYYLLNFPTLKQTGTGRWAAMFGLLNLAFRPLGGIVADLIYRRSSVWGKKAWMHFLGVVTGAFLIAIGVTDSKVKSTMFGLIAGMAFFLEAGNGANYALVPHVHPHANGIISGTTGAAGNLGGIIFAIIFRYQGEHYGTAFWIIGIVNIVVNLALSWVSPIPRGQVGGR